MMHAAEAPIGWPSAQAPTSTYRFSRGIPSLRIAAIGTTAKSSPISQPASSSTLRTAATSAVANTDGFCA